MARIAGRFARVEPRRRARAFVLGLLSGLRRTNCWTIAEQAGTSQVRTIARRLPRRAWQRYRVAAWPARETGIAGAARACRS